MPAMRAFFRLASLTVVWLVASLATLAQTDSVPVFET